MNGVTMYTILSPLSFVIRRMSPMHGPGGLDGHTSGAVTGILSLCYPYSGWWRRPEEEGTANASLNRARQARLAPAAVTFSARRLAHNR